MSDPRPFDHLAPWPYQARPRSGRGPGTDRFPFGTSRRALLPALSCALLVLLSAGCGDDAGTGPGDTVPPAAPVLEARAVQDDAVLLRWTAPGDDGMTGRAAQYDLRCANCYFATGDWESADALQTPQTPASPGDRDSVLVSDLSPGIWYFAVRAVDEVGNWSPPSNPVVVVVEDDLPPEPITDLSVSGRTVGSVTLNWTAPGDDCAIGCAAMYDVRYATAPITAETWASASQARCEPDCGMPGKSESFTVPDLEPDCRYYFALQTLDWRNNRSELSNFVDETTLPVTRVTTSTRGTGPANPSWSPDGTKIAVDADWDIPDVRHVYTTLGGGSTERLTRSFASETNPSWSPDGSRIVFAAAPDDEEPTCELWILETRQGASPVLLVRHEGMTLQDCAWSPDGSRIAYVVSTCSPICRYDIYTISADGGTPVAFAAGMKNERYPCWSPEGTHIAFAWDRWGDYDIWIRPAEGGEAVRITENRARDTHPAWSPDGSRIAFTSDRRGYGNVWLVSIDEGAPQQLTFGRSGGVGPSWSSNGQQICYIARDGEIGDLWILPLE